MTEGDYLTYLINPEALQNVLTKACRSGKEIPLASDVAQVTTPVGSFSNGNGVYNENEARNGNVPQYLPPTEAPGPAVRSVVLLAKDGNLMSQSDGLGSDKASFYAALASKMWQQQVSSAKDVECLLEGQDPVTTSANLENAAATSDDNKNGRHMGGLNYIFSMHENKMFCVAPSHAYLLLMIADADFPMGLLKNKCLSLAKSMQPHMEKVTPAEFSDQVFNANMSDHESDVPSECPSLESQGQGIESREQSFESIDESFESVNQSIESNEQSIEFKDPNFESADKSIEFKDQSFKSVDQSTASNDQSIELKDPSIVQDADKDNDTNSKNKDEPFLIVESDDVIALTDEEENIVE